MDEENLNEFLVGDPPPLIFTQILPLKKLAMLQLATTMCYCSFRRVLKWDIYEYDIYRGTLDFNSDVLNEESIYSDTSLYVYVVKRVIPRLSLPSILRDMLKWYVCYVIVEVKEWANYHRYKIFCQRKNDMHVYNYVDEIVWKSDGEIDWRETAIRILSHRDISEMEKFRIMANYCLEEHFGGVPLSLEFEKELHEGNDMMAYWYKVVKGYPPSLGDEFDFERFEWGNIHAFLYFWSRLNADQQMDEAVRLIKGERKNLIYLRALLLKMNETQQRQILTRVGDEICCNFSRTTRYFGYGVLVWMHIREFITEEQYIGVMTNLMIKYSHYDNSYFKRVILSVGLHLVLPPRLQRFSLCPPRLTELLTFIWRTAPDRVKRQGLNVETGTGLFTLFSSGFNFDVEISISLLVNILPTMEANHRRNVFDGIITKVEESENRQIFDWLLVSTREPRLLNKFLTLCLANPDEEAAFKEKWITPCVITYHCCYLIANGRFTDFDKFVDVYPSEMIGLHDSKMDLLTKMLSDSSCLVKSKINLLTVMLLHELSSDVYEVVTVYKPVPRNLKIFCSDIETEVLIDILLIFEECCDIEILFSLLVELLPDMSADRRRNILGMIMLMQGSKAIFLKELMVDFRRPLLLDKFIKLCLSDVEDEVTAFKSKWIKPKWITKHCLHLIETGEWENVDEFLTLYLPRETRVGDYKIQLFNSRPVIEILLRNLLYSEKYDRINKIVNVMFPRGDSANDFRKQFLLSKDAIAHFHSLVKSGHIDDIKNCIELFLRSEEHIRMVKKSILQSMFSHQLPSTFFHCDDYQWSLFVLWFLNDDESSNKFKNSLDLHEILSQLLFEESELLMKNNFHPGSSFYALDRFLHWYFGSHEKVKEFKKDRILNFQSISFISELATAATGEWSLPISSEWVEIPLLDPSRAKYCLDEILRWFFVNDGDLIQKFESAYSWHDIAKSSFFMSVRR